MDTAVGCHGCHIGEFGFIGRCSVDGGHATRVGHYCRLVKWLCSYTWIFHLLWARPKYINSYVFFGPPGDGISFLHHSFNVGFA